MTSTLSSLETLSPLETLSRPAATTRTVGTWLSRVDAIAKVTGQARYAGEFPLDDLAFGWLVTATVARGSIASIDHASAYAQYGVLAVIDHTNAERLTDPGDATLLQLQDDQVRHWGQVVAMVIAETSEQARSGAEALVVRYQQQEHDVLLAVDHPRIFKPDKVNPAYPAEVSYGDIDEAFAAAAVQLDQWYRTPAEHNNPMEPHACTARWDGQHLTVFDSNQGAYSVRTSLAKLFSLPSDAVRVLSDYVGGGFGSKGTARVPAVLATMASRALDRPVRVSLTRQQMYYLTGYRTPTIQQVRLAADEHGQLQALDHLAYSQTSQILEFAEQTAVMSRMMYASRTLRSSHRLVALDVPTPRWMRAPGEAPGAFALESAMDELAELAGIDPIELRIINEPQVEPGTGRGYSSRNLVGCLRQGALLFGWSERDRRPGVRRDGRWLIGTGVAAGTYPANNAPTTCTIQADPDGTFEVRITASDIGTGARTALGQVAADALQVPIDRLRLRLGDSDFGQAMIAGGSMGTASWSWAIVKAARELRQQLSEHGLGEDGLSVTADTRADVAAATDLVRHSYGAQFAEVRVDEATGEVRIARLVGVFTAGQIVNPIMARSQFIGGMTMGISMALHEESIMDVQFGDYVNHDLAGYHIAAHADVPAIEVSWLAEDDDQTNPSGIKGIGEVGIVGTAAAIANAVWHATGRRQRELPIRPDRVLRNGR
ncbi:MAG: xanthine dehydrogenase family protein molybdopterin-binding subunit [Jatrophihabitantaceae bacterium]